nr:hypothetical protein [Tanacetum cinerariifolium]
MIWITASKAFPITFSVLVISASLERLFIIPWLSYESTYSSEELLEVSNRHGILFVFTPGSRSKKVEGEIRSLKTRLNYVSAQALERERQIGKGKLRLLDNDGNPLVPAGIMKSDSEVEVVFNETANLRISTSDKDGSDKGYGTNSLLKQWMDPYPDNDDYDTYDDDMYENRDLSEHLQSICDDLYITTDTYDDDMYENHDLSEHLQSICDDLYITICGRKKK